MEPNQQEPLFTLEERIEQEIEAAFIRHGFTVDGGPEIGVLVDPAAFENKVYDLVSAAVVDKRANRGKVALTRRAMMSSVFPDVAGPEGWAEHEEPDIATGVYKRLDDRIWRLTSPDATGKIQRRLNSDIGLTLCRTKAVPANVWAVYVTADLACVLADYTGPQMEAMTKQTKKFASNLVMVVNRMPEHSKRFKRELLTGSKDALTAGAAILDPAIEAAEFDLSEDGDTGDGQ